MTAKRLYLVVGAAAAIVYIGALWNRFALDDNPVVLFNPLFRAPGAMWKAFLTSYWPPEVGGGLYRPLTIASYALDWSVATYALEWSVGPMVWFHAVNIAWHAGVSVLVAWGVRRWSGDTAALIAGLLFAVHPVHVEAVANIVGRAELMAALFALLAVYAALGRDSLALSTAALVAGLLSKENAAVVPGLVVWGWMLGFQRPSRRRMLAYAASWVAVAIAYVVVRHTALRDNALIYNLAPVWFGASPWQIRLTAVAAFADFARLLVFPLTLRVDYSPAERTLVTTPFDMRFLLGLLCLALWGGLLALAAGAWLKDLAPARLRLLAVVLVLAGGVRTALRVPVWSDSYTVVKSELKDSPRSYDGHAKMVTLFLNNQQPERALKAFQVATGIYDQTLPWLYVSGAEAAFVIGRHALADSLLQRLERACVRCEHYYQYEAVAARVRGYNAFADTLIARAKRTVAARHDR